MGRAIDRRGMRYGLLTVVDRAPGHAGNGGILWNCRCECGATKVVSGGDLHSGTVRTCGDSMCIAHIPGDSGAAGCVADGVGSVKVVVRRGGSGSTTVIVG